MKKIICYFVPIFLCAVLLTSTVVPAIQLSEDISSKVFRLHILANSDSIEDQALKLRVRDKVLDATRELYNSCDSLDEAINVTNENISYIKTTAQKVIAFYGYEYDTNVYTTREYFSTRKYDKFTLPAGIYDSLKIEIGEAKGHNWWCVMFPTVCLSGCTDELSGTLTQEEMELIQNDKYVIRFRTIELYEKIKSKF